MRLFAVLLLIANVAVFIWGWASDRPLDRPLPEVPQAPGRIDLPGESAPPR